MYKTFTLILTTLLLNSCFLINNENKSCYRIKQKKVYLRYYGGYPRAKEVFLEVKGADAKSFEYIEGSREGACQGGHMYGMDSENVYYRTRKIDFANNKSFHPLGYGLAKDRNNVFYRDSVIEKADAESFFVIKNKRRLAYGADKYGLIIRNKRIGGEIDAKSFEVLPRPYSKDKNKVYFTEDFKIVEGADPATFTCPKFESIVNYQYYSYDKNNAYYYERGKVIKIPDIHYPSFLVLNSHYAKDKNKVYYQWKVIEGADPFTFHIPVKINRRIGQDKNHRYKEGEIE